MLPVTLVDGPAQFYRPVAEKHDDRQRLSRHLRAIARLKPGVSIPQAASDLEVVNRGLAKQFPDEYSTPDIRVVKLRDDIAAGLRPQILVLLGAIGFLLLIACTNLSNLLLARAIGRQKEVQIRSALGASRARLVQHILTGSMLIALCGGTVGILLAFGGTKAIVAIGARVIPQLVNVSLDGRVLLFTIGLSLATGLLFCLGSPLRLSAIPLSDTLKEGTRTSSLPHDTFRSGLAVSEIALSLVLLAGAGLLLRSFSKLYGTEKPRAFYQELLERISRLPGVESAGAVSILPLGTNFDTAGAEPEGFLHDPGKMPYPERYVVTPGYLRTLGIRLVRGRFFADADNQSAPLGVLVSNTAAQRWWPDQDPIGRHLKMPGFEDRPQPWRTVVGVVADVKQASLEAPTGAQVYLPHAQYSIGDLTLVVRTKSDPLNLADEVRRQVMKGDPEQAVSNIATMEQVLSDSISSRRFSAALLGTLAVLGLVLASVGVYGVISYGVSQRTREIGIRMALGAGQGEVMSLVVGQGTKLLLLGIAVGTFAAWLLTPVMSGLLFAIRPGDPLTFASSALFLALVAVLACYIPARRAAKVDPIVALRSE